MVVDEHVRKLLDKTIKGAIENYTVGGISNLDNHFRKRWKVENDYEWTYGYIIGTLEGTLRLAYMEYTKREVTSEDSHELTEIIELHAKDIREMLSGLKE